MIRILSLAAALAVLPLSGTYADEKPKTPSEAAIEAAAEAFEARMEAMSARAEAISEDESLTEAQRAARIEALQAEYQPEIAAFTATVTQQAGQIAAEALANIDIGAIVQQAVNDPEVQAAIQQGVAGGAGIARNSAWTNPDPEQLRTYGLIAQYALDQASDAVEDADEASEDPEDAEDAEDAEADEAPEVAEAPERAEAPHYP
ncbi:hypothetical protein BH09PSE1_BH09PSE1_27270 [soil metagenome]